MILCQKPFYDLVRLCNGWMAFLKIETGAMDLYDVILCCGCFGFRIIITSVNDGSVFELLSLTVVLEFHL